MTHFSEIDIARNYPDRPETYGRSRIDPDDPTGKREFFNLNSANQGGLEHQLIAVSLEFGVCEERFAPWFPPLNAACRNETKYRSSCVLSALKEQWQRYHRASDGAEYNRYDRCYLDAVSYEALPPSKQKELERIVAKVGLYLEPQIALGLDLRDALANTESEFDFIEYVLTPPQCRDNRTRLSGSMWMEDWSLNYTKYDRRTNPDGSTTTTKSRKPPVSESIHSNKERFSRLTERIKDTGRSVALGLCSHFALSPAKTRRDDSSSADICGPHALVMNGVRWNAASGTCEVHLRNSWGEKTQLRGWVPVEPFLNSTFRVSGIDPGSKY